MVRRAERTWLGKGRVDAVNTFECCMAIGQ